METYYAVKGLFRWVFKDGGATASFEERLILVLASSFDEALDRAEQEAREYCEDDPGANITIESLNKYRAYEILDKLESGVEIFSERRESGLGVSEYLARYYPEAVGSGESGQDW